MNIHCVSRFGNEMDPSLSATGISPVALKLEFPESFTANQSGSKGRPSPAIELKQFSIQSWLSAPFLASSTVPLALLH